MAINLLRRRSLRPKPGAPSDAAPAVNIGEPDAHVFMCPRCSRPLSNGTPRCPGCGQRLVLGVAMRRAALLTGTGLIVGAFLGSVIVSGLITSMLGGAASAVASTITQPAQPSATASVVPSASIAPTATPLPAPPLPAAAASALQQTTLLDQRIATDAGALLTAYERRSSAADVARALRLVASDAAIGTTQLDGLRSWDQAAALAAQREAYYAAVSKAAQAGLRSSLADMAAYRTAASTTLRALRGMPTIDAAARKLAATVDLTLAPVKFGALAR